jgi:hypothetical protein
MTKKLFSILFTITLPLSLLAQSAFSDCDHIYEKVQHLPSLKISNEAFEDTLSAELNSKNFLFKNNEIQYEFVVTNSSKIDELTTQFGNVAQKKILDGAILHFAHLWKSATQNGYDVCSYVKLKLRFENKKVSIEITQ